MDLKLNQLGPVLGVAGAAAIAYQVDQGARMILVEQPNAIDEEAAGLARVLLTRARYQRRLPSQVIRTTRGDKFAIWNGNLTEYLARMDAARAKHGTARYLWAVRRTIAGWLGAEGAAVGSRYNFLHRGSLSAEQLEKVGAWANQDPITIGITTFSSPVKL